MRSKQPGRALRYARSFLEMSKGAACVDESEQGAKAEAVSESDRAQATLLVGHALLELGRPADALEPLSTIDAGTTPIPDHVYWLRARAHEASGAASKAADLYGRIFDYDDTPLKYRARARQAHVLVEAERASEALPIIRKLLDLFPNYPRRFRLLYDRANALEELGRETEAAEAYQTAWYEYPHKSTGEWARARLEALADRGIEPAPLRPEELFDRYRQLRINKHWSLAERLFKRLLERIEGGRPKLEHRIRMQLALNAFVPKRNEEALKQLRALRSDWEAGRRAGIQIDLVDKYLSRTLSRLGRFEEALEAKRRQLAGRRKLSQRRALLEFYRDHSRYEKAYEIADGMYSDARKKRWPFLWLLYKTGRFERAAEGFESYASARSGRRAAKGKYWRARTLERLDRPEDAKQGYTQVADQHGSGYYGMQALNRLRDLKNRAPVDQLFSGEAGSVLDSSDEIFAAFDRASPDGGTPPTRAVDPKTVPRRADRDEGGLDRGGITASDCFGGTEQQRAFCRLLAGDVPSETMDVIGRAIVPFRPSSNGTVASGEDAETGGEQHEASSAAPDDSGGAASARKGQKKRIDFTKPARIHWSGRGGSESDFERWERSEMIGPVPEPPMAYGDRSHAGGVERAARKAGDLFPALERTHWLFEIGMFGAARTAVREAALEYRGVVDRRRPPDGRPHELPYRRWTYHIDHRRYGDGYWGYEGDEVERFPVPDSATGRRELADRQQEIWKRRNSLRPHLVDAMKEAGDYHLVRKFTQEKGGWYNRSPTGPARDLWMQAYPRAFPHHVVRKSREHGINPYLIWALMTVESAYNPDSISTAEAIGLLQVIPRTGIKVASWVGDEDFGPYDLIDEEVAIGQGVHYFSSLVRKFRGQELLAMIGYNGGPHRVATWLERKSPMPIDEFVEEVPFDQARHYVKKVTRFVGLYLRLYEGRNSLYVGQNIDRNVRADPNF